MSCGSRSIATEHGLTTFPRLTTLTRSIVPTISLPLNALLLSRGPPCLWKHSLLSLSTVCSLKVSEDPLETQGDDARNSGRLRGSSNSNSVLSSSLSNIPLSSPSPSLSPELTVTTGTAGICSLSSSVEVTMSVDLSLTIVVTRLILCSFPGLCVCRFLRVRLLLFLSPPDLGPLLISPSLLENSEDEKLSR